ncbi:Transducin/WD40 repeat-like superfamily protein [Striga hermonthica]|uniref:Transducin/WD40 repeat-like superfamily protein n=1 Tax=Striga hermonthica TaxID=68872 RepID=A0A9N7R382_STRHE|nr:Transducin/WD40 repeat-like superfamily protein [Striga hermonthica]
MDSFKEDDQESHFFDALEHITQEPDQVSNFHPLKNWDYNVWINVPQSVGERRIKFIRLMGLSPDGLEGENHHGAFMGDVDRIMEKNGTVLRTSSFEYEFSSSRSSASSWNTDDSDLLVQENVAQFCPASNQNHTEGETEASCYTPRTRDKLKNKWLRKWKAMICMMKSNSKDENLSRGQGRKISRVRVRHGSRKLKELSGLFTGQDIQAHKGSILTMKFSLDGCYLASAGEDMVVKVWKVIENERNDAVDIPDDDPSCVYFSINSLSELGPLMVEKDKGSRFKGLRKNTDSACIIFPPKVFRILEEPLHVFEGHNGDILDLSWSKDNCLLSSSVDNTVRLWKVGFDQCLKVFSHTDYVTCVQFNPANDDYFISGSIDGKVRIWTINGCQVVDWVETRDIITAVSYRPDGQSGVFGSIGGTCYFFSASDNHFHLETQMCLINKKSPCKRITGFQFLPQDPTKVLVTCADAHVRIIDGLNVIGKYKGFRKAGNQISASFTSDGKHVISASEDSSVYIWNYEDQSSNSPKVINSFECFSTEASIALPWLGLKSNILQETINSLPFSSSTHFSLTQEFLMDAGSKGTATWPEEKLVYVSSPKSTKSSSLGRSQYKLFKTSCESSSNSHAWGLVIVTAGWDGRIKSFQNYGLPAPV